MERVGKWTIATICMPFFVVYWIIALVATLIACIIYGLVLVPIEATKDALFKEEP